LKKLLHLISSHLITSELDMQGLLSRWDEWCEFDQYNGLFSCSSFTVTLTFYIGSICCGFVVQQVIRHIHTKSNRGASKSGRQGRAYLSPHWPQTKFLL